MADLMGVAEGTYQKYEKLALVPVTVELAALALAAGIRAKRR
jgi:hypothetical protein